VGSIQLSTAKKTTTTTTTANLTRSAVILPPSEQVNSRRVFNNSNPTINVLDHDSKSKQPQHHEELPSDLTLPGGILLPTDRVSVQQHITTTSSTSVSCRSHEHFNQSHGARSILSSPDRSDGEDLMGGGQMSFVYGVNEEAEMGLLKQISMEIKVTSNSDSSLEKEEQSIQKLCGEDISSMDVQDKSNPGLQTAFLVPDDNEKSLSRSNNRWSAELSSQTMLTMTPYHLGNSTTIANSTSFSASTATAETAPQFNLPMVVMIPKVELKFLNTNLHPIFLSFESADLETEYRIQSNRKSLGFRCRNFLNYGLCLIVFCVFFAATQLERGAWFVAGGCTYIQLLSDLYDLDDLG
jgi:hypothetical protein